MRLTREVLQSPSAPARPSRHHARGRRGPSRRMAPVDQNNHSGGIDLPVGGESASDDTHPARQTWRLT
jgi:hypothetical protein